MVIASDRSAAHIRKQIAGDYVREIDGRAMSRFYDDCPSGPSTACGARSVVRNLIGRVRPSTSGMYSFVYNSYVTHTALHRALADAWRAAGNADSAAAHTRWVRMATGRR